ncbi:MAG: right-handed parallel beta-helix repeat-containing protein [Phycisphaeraceae bacterium]|nr:right-handed parallel beta-helix repeat-containing protein [Phycisphaeraceae bacterium]
MRTHPVVAAVFAGLVCTAALAGPIDPPAGPVTSTYKTLDQVEPRIPITAQTCPGNATVLHVISAPGSYYLTGNLDVPAGKFGISITSDDVTIDLAGYTIAGGINGSGGITGFGVARKRITIRNGNIRGMVHGINLTQEAGPGSESWWHVLEGLNVRGANTSGILVYSGIVRDCSASHNADTGIQVVTNAATVVDRCTAERNGGTGIIVAGNGSATVSNCVAGFNSSGGIYCQRGVVVDCSATGNSGSGINVASGVIRNSHAEANTWGFYGASITVEGCSAAENSATGITATSRSVVSNNFVNAATLKEGAYGIEVWNTGSRVESNTIVNYAVGIRATNANNLIVRNAFRSCTKAVQAPAGNRVGTLLTGAASGSIDGNTGGGLGTTDPYANIIY